MRELLKNAQNWSKANGRKKSQKSAQKVTQKVTQKLTAGKCDLIPRNKGPNEYFWEKF
jgi:hypothetical protein